MSKRPMVPAGAAKRAKMEPTVVIKNPEVLEAKPDQPKPRRLKSCTRCRKHKVKCDFVTTEPHPCTSCVKKGVVCELEIVVPVKRSNLIKDMKNCVLELKVTVDELVKQDQMLRNLCLEKGIAVDGLVDVTSLEQSDLTSEDEDDYVPKPPVPERELFVADKFSMRFAEVSVVVDWFNANILPILPIMNPITSPTIVYEKSPLLFWSIMCISMVSMKRLTIDQLAGLSVYVKTLLIEATWMSTPKSITIVQAILLMASFPVFCTSMDDDLEDSCFRWLEIAKCICLQTGVNRGSQFVNEFSRRKDISPLNGEEFEVHEGHMSDEQIRERIWASVFIQGNECGARLGLPWDQRLDALIDRLRFNDQGKTVTYFQTILETIVVYSKITEQMGKSFRTPSGLISNTHGLSTALSMWHYILHMHRVKIADKFRGSDVEKKVARIRVYECKLDLCLFGGTLDGVNEDEELNDVSVRKALEVSLSIEEELVGLGRGYSSLPISVRHTAELAALVLFRLVYFPFVVQDPALQNAVAHSVRRFHAFFSEAMRDPLTAALNPSLRKTVQLMLLFDQNVLSRPTVYWKNTRLLRKMSGHLSMNVFYEIESMVDPDSTETYQDDMDDDAFFQRLGIKGTALIERIKSPKPLGLSDRNHENDEHVLDETIDDLVNLVGKSQEEDLGVLNKLLKQIE